MAAKLTKPKGGKKMSAAAADGLIPRMIRVTPEMDEWLQQHARAEGYASVPELMRNIVREYWKSKTGQA